ncbi:ABC transporter ATP-binding protein [Nocardioides sp. NPDC057772]|uniref:ABC transporter ATP-binding protein n=1 Tax=Nocardioides sp. NPDC057772 TaxID=3346245 RepID=UPI00366E9DE7
MTSTTPNRGPDSMPGTPSAPPTAGRPYAVQLTDVHRSYRNGSTTVQALRGVSVSLPVGSVTAVMGPSGSGKSTLLNCAAGLDTPNSGRVVVGDRDISALSFDALARFRREHIGFVFQAYNLIPHLSVEENILLPMLLAGRQPDLAWLTEIVDAVGLDGLGHRRPGELSGGQAQRVAIARALLTRPMALFADEPTGALDSRTGIRILGTMLGTAKRLGQTVVIVTHDPSVAAAAEQVLFLADGRLVDRLEAPLVEDITERMVALGRR